MFFRFLQLFLPAKAVEPFRFAATEAQPVLAAVDGHLAAKEARLRKIRELIFLGDAVLGSWSGW